MDRSHRQSNLLCAICPPAQLLSSVLVNNLDLIFIYSFPWLCAICFLPSAQRFRIYRRVFTTFPSRDLPAWHSRVPGFSTPGEVQCTGTTPESNYTRLSRTPRVIVVSGWLFRLTAGLPSTSMAASFEWGSIQQSRPNALLFWCRRLELKGSPNRKRVKSDISPYPARFQKGVLFFLHA